LQKAKQNKTRFATVTAYYYSCAKLSAQEGLHFPRLGNPRGTTVQSLATALPVTVADMPYHTAAVRRGAPDCLLLAELQFMAYA
ncbi:3-methyl-2-oxobutanoate hydroxymethyltransferase, partial [Escherichia coli]|nr:3-methyl-2-oxobutanoate hydroxymethyltransferase [Escherichia coli]